MAVSWNTRLRTKHWTTIIENANCSAITNRLFQGIDGRPIISSVVKQEVQASAAIERGNELVLDYIFENGSLESFRDFITVLKGSSDFSATHGKLAEILEQDFSEEGMKEWTISSASCGQGNSTSTPSKEIRITRKQEPTPEEVRQFLRDEELGFHTLLKDFCDIRVIASDLLLEGVINRANYEQIGPEVSTSVKANSIWYGILYSQASVRKLKAMCKTLKKDTAIEPHMKLAKLIDDFIKFESQKAD